MQLLLPEERNPAMSAAAHFQASRFENLFPTIHNSNRHRALSHLWITTHLWYRLLQNSSWPQAISTNREWNTDFPLHPNLQSANFLLMWCKNIAHLWLSQHNSNGWTNLTEKPGMLWCVVPSLPRLPLLVSVWDAPTDKGCILCAEGRRFSPILNSTAL